MNLMTSLPGCMTHALSIRLRWELMTSTQAALVKLQHAVVPPAQVSTDDTREHLL